MPHVSEIETPALVVDLDILERNLRRVAAYAGEHGLRLRPHTKTHKSILLAKRQLELGAVGLTVAKVSEAEVMLGAGPADLLVAFPIVGRAKLARLMEVARRTRVTVALDSLAAARELSAAAREAQTEVGVLAEFDAGLGRVGVMPGEPLLELARSIRQLPHLNFQGLTFYPGHIKDLGEAGRHALTQLSELVGSIRADFERAGVEVPIVSGGCAMEDCAATILATVVSVARPGHMILDGGSKTFSSDRPVNSAEVTFGHVVEAPAARFHKMNEEHGFVELAGVEREFGVGDRVHVIPNHICVAVNLHERAYGVRGDRVEEIWNVDARGKLQ